MMSCSLTNHAVEDPKSDTYNEICWAKHPDPAHRTLTPKKGKKDMLGPSANPAMVVLVIVGFFLLTGGLAYVMGASGSRSKTPHKGF